MLDGAVELMRRIKADFVYEIGATTASTTPPMSFALRRGVCQDFAHIMISGMRGLGLPAAYVSGYLRTVPTAGRAARGRRRHARLGAGVVRRGGRLARARSDQRDFAGDDHVVLAIGRDYADVAPIDGVIFASGGQRLEVSVSVTRRVAAAGVAAHSAAAARALAPCVLGRSVPEMEVDCWWFITH